MNKYYVSERSEYRPLRVYIRNKKRQKIGVLYSFLNHDKQVVFGWSLCSKLDRFNPYTGTTIAYERGLSNDRYIGKDILTILPHTIKNSSELQKFMIRIKQFYKQTPLHPFLETIIYSYWIDYLKSPGAES